jgi:hypothetical protein
MRLRAKGRAEVSDMVKTEAFDAARYLTSPDAQAELLNDALASGNAAYVAHAFGVTARARGMTEVEGLPPRHGRPSTTYFSLLHADVPSGFTDRGQIAGSGRGLPHHRIVVRWQAQYGLFPLRCCS